MSEVDDSAKGVRAATPLPPRTWRQYLTLRPEIAAIVAFVVAVAVLGIVARHTIAFQVSDSFSGLAHHPCIFEHKGKLGMNDVKDWDMSALSKDKTSCSTKHCTDHSVTRGDEVFFLNVCRNTMNRPDECIGTYGEKKRVPKAIGYQTADGVCYKMGDLKTGKWSLLDPNNAKAGVKVTYTGGARCDGYTERSTSFHFECDPMAGIGEPSAVFGDCEFVVRWKTAKGCPIQPSVFLPILFWVGFLTGAYLVLHFIHNIWVANMIPDWEAVPHIQLIRYIGALLLMIFEKLWDTSSKIAPRLAASAGTFYDRFIGQRSKSSAGYTGVPSDDEAERGRNR